MPFGALGLEPRILQSVREAGYTEPTPIQAAAIPQILAGHDIIGIAQTGTGKTAAFVLPILTMMMSRAATGPGTRALIIAPTRELVAQIDENVRAYAKHLPLRAAAVFGGVGERPQINALRQGVEIVIATPGRLLDLMRQRHSNFSALQFLVLDEGDRMLDMGFLPAIRDVVRALPQRRQTLLFCATMSKEIEGLTHQFQRSPKTVQIGRRSNPAVTVTQRVYEVPQQRKMDLLIHLLREDSFTMVLLFSRTKHGADKIARRLEQHGINTATLHANRSQNQRLRALEDFKNGAVRILVATDIAARGIDVEGISHVVNYDLPKHPEDYVHRIGRTGRAHAIGDAISFATPEDMTALRSLERFIGQGLVRGRAEGFDLRAPLNAPGASVQRPQQLHQPTARRGPTPPGGGRSQGGVNWRGPQRSSATGFRHRQNGGPNRQQPRGPSKATRRG